MKSLMITTGSILLTAGVLANAYYQKKQFYPSVVYITKSSPSMAILYLQAFVCVVLFGKMLRKLFFGQLRAAEMEHLIERSWYAVTETCLAFTVFRDDFSPRFVALFTLLLFLKCFHWLAEDRVDYMERSPIITFRFHLRAIALLNALAFIDGYFVAHAYYSTLLKGASVQLVFGFEYAILLTVVIHTFVKYVLHAIDLQNENPWESKTVYLLYAELLLGFVKVVLYMLFLFIMIKVHTFPLFAIRPMYLTMRTFKKAMNDVIQSRRAIRNMNTLYPDATQEELAAGDNVCIICREEMTEGCKKLPCNHIFHTSCLRSWFQRQQTCPTCRMDILRSPAARPPVPPQANAPPAAGAQPQVPPAFPAFPFPMWPQQEAAPIPQPPQPGVSSSTTGTATATQATTSGTATSIPTTLPPTGAATTWPPFMMPPMFMPMPFSLPPPMPDSNFSGMSEEELRSMEGQERHNLEARVQCLRNIHTLLDAAMVQVQQYTTVVQNLGVQGENPLGAAGASAFNPQAFYGAATNTTDSVKSPRTSVTMADASTSQSTAPSATNTSMSTGAGARAKEVASSSPLSPSTNTPDVSDLEGAVGYSVSKSEVPSDLLDNPEGDTTEMNEVRRRRLQRFSSENLQALGNNDSSKKLDDSQELD